jgi:hypothetical protein
MRAIAFDASPETSTSITERGLAMIIGNPRRRLAPAFAAALTLSVVMLFGGASAAWAGVGFSVVPDVPDSVTVGTTVPSTFTIVNNSDGANIVDPIQLASITLVPSCGTNIITGADCPVGSTDRGVLIPSATGVGQAGTACAGTSFSFAETDSVQGKYTLTPSVAVVLGPANSVDPNAKLCRVVFTTFVARFPLMDSVPPATNGVQTNQIGFASGNDICTACGARAGQFGLGVGTDQTDVLKATPAITTLVSSATRTIGQTFTDVATLTFPTGAPVPTGSVTFTLYGPGDTSCGTPIATSTVAVNGSAQATSGTFTPTLVGTYRVIASYGGDINYNPIAGVCNDPGENVVVSKATPAIATLVSNPTRTVGQSFTDVATVTAAAGAPLPTGTVDFAVYAPGDTSCAGAPVFTSTARPLGAATATTATATSASFTPLAPGTYRVIATYNGDANYNSLAGVCNDPGENVVVSKATPAIATLVSNPTRTVGQSFTDLATVTFPATAPTPTGNVTFVVYGPGDTSCTGVPVFTSPPSTVGSASATTVTAMSASFTPQAPGTYRVIATYNGDANYNSIAGICNDPGENVVVSKATPAIVTAVSAATRTLGQSFTDDATVTTPPGGPGATGDVTFVVYGPGDSTCTGSPVFTSAARPLSGATPTTATATSASFTPTVPGTYRVIATYNGDTNYTTIAGLCGDANEQVVVAKASPTIATTVSAPARTLGQSFTDMANVTVPAGLPAPTGTVDFVVYAPGDTNCTGVPIFSSTGIALNGSGSATSASFTPTAIGTYRVIATYSGE